MIAKLVKLSLRHPYIVLLLGVVWIVVGVQGFRSLPIQAYPDVSDTFVQVISQWPGHAAEEMEQQITIPIEVEMNGVPNRTSLRSVSLFGLSVVTIVFDDDTTPFVARQYVLEKLSQVRTPPGVDTSLGPMTSSVGRIYWYTLDSPNRTSMELKEIQDWEIERRIRTVPGIAMVSSFGGAVKQFQVLVDPLSLAHYNLSIAAVSQALANNNQNAGGSFITQGEQALNIRGVGKIDNEEDIRNIIISEKSGTPIRIKNIGQVVIGPQVRLGQISTAERMPDGTIKTKDDAVEGIVFTRKGEIAEKVLDGLKKKVEYLNDNVLPPDVKIKPHLDRSTLIELTTHTVQSNLIEGMLLVVGILLFFLGNLRSALIVAATIPLSLLFASIFLDLRNIPANLLSLGALDFGMVVDGAVVMVENVFRHLQIRKEKGGKGSIVDVIGDAAQEVQRPIVYAIAVIILAYLPIFTLQRIEGRLFSPMAWTVAFTLLGSLIVSLTLVPVLCSFLFKKELHEWHNPLMGWIDSKYKIALNWALKNPVKIAWMGAGSFLLAILLAFGGIIGSEFLPHLNEGSIWIRGTLPPSASFELANNVVKKARNIVMEYPEVPKTVCQMGRPDDGTDATGFFNVECFVDLKLKKHWRSQFKNKEDLIESMNKELKKVPGVIWNFSQPISDDVEEMMAGVKGAVVVKVFGKDLKLLESTADRIQSVLSKVKGIKDLGVFDVMGQPNVNIIINRDEISRYGLNISDIQDLIETAVGGKTVSQIRLGERRFDLALRLQNQYRDDVDRIRRILVSTPEGYRVPLEDLADIKIEEGASMIYRDGNSRYIAVKFSVRGRDLGGTIAEAQKSIKKSVLLPSGYHMEWLGEFESQRRAEARLAFIVPLTVFGIFLVLLFVFKSLKWALIIMTCVATARVGGVLALFLTGTNFSVSSGIGFLAVFGVSIQTGMIMISYINQLRAQGMSIKEAVVQGASLRLRPILMTALVATFGLLPAAMSSGIGSDSQKPLAIVVVGGLITDLVMSSLLLPVLYLWYAKPDDTLEG